MTDTTEIIKRVTRAMVIALHTKGCGDSMQENGQIIVSPDIYFEARRVALAVVAAMREPTEEVPEDVGSMEGFDCVLYEDASDDPHIDFWKPTIDAALEETK